MKYRATEESQVTRSTPKPSSVKSIYLLFAIAVLVGSSVFLVTSRQHGSPVAKDVSLQPPPPRSDLRIDEMMREEIANYEAGLVLGYDGGEGPGTVSEVSSIRWYR